MKHLLLAAFAASTIFSFFTPCLLVAQAQLGEIQVSADAPPESSERPSAFVSVIQPKAFDTQVKSLPELLSEQSGVQVNQFGGLGHLSTISIRGSSAEQVSVFVDGVKINTAQGGAVDFSSLPLDQIDHIEIIKGGASSEFGSDAMGGVIQIKTKRASAKKQSYEFSLGGASFNTLQIQNSFSHRFSKSALYLSHSHLQSEGDFTFRSTPTEIGGVTLGGGEKYTRENNQFFSENGLLKWEIFPSEKWELRLLSDWMGSRRHVPPTEEEFILLTPVNPAEAKEQLLKNLSSAQLLVHDLGFKNLELEVQPYYRLDQSHFEDASPGLGPPIDTQYKNQSFGSKLALRYQGRSGIVDHKISFFYEPRLDWLRSEDSITSLEEEHHRFTHAFYLGDELSFFSQRLSVQPSLRFENTTDFASRFAGHLGLIYKALSWLVFKTNVDQAFRYPNFNELYFPNQGIIRGNPELAPEKSVNMDVGFVLEHHLGPHQFRHQFSYFKNWIDNSIVFVPISAFTIAPLNTQQVHTQGFEWNSFVHLGSHVDVEGNYTFLKASLQDSGKQLPGRAKHKANGKLTLKNSWAALYVSLQYIDQLPIDFQNSTFIKSRSQLDLGVSLLFKKHLSFNFDVKNVSNVQLLDSRGFPLPGRSFFLSVGAKI
ncbi:MAG: TonB-dependent receptor [Deltaproteobacteria bacterium]|nr:TonB-dependent receptor [Deltaproteobacteria bacterium]